jgi:hypothetical protein
VGSIKIHLAMTSRGYEPEHLQGNSPQVHGQQHLPLEKLQANGMSWSTSTPQLPHANLDNDPSTEALLSNQSATYREEDKRVINTSSFEMSSIDLEQPIRYPTSVPMQARFGIPSSSDQRKAQERFDLRDWQWEFAAPAFSLICSAGMVTVLALYQDKSLSKWNFVFDISLNTLIATLSTLSRTALLVPITSCISQLKWIHLVDSPRSLSEVQVFDDASRGPWGAFGLIWKLRFKTKLAAWGSIITILTLAMGPFAQQLLSYPSRLQISPKMSEATFYASQVYDSGTSRGLTGGRFETGKN